MDDIGESAKEDPHNFITESIMYEHHVHVTCVSILYELVTTGLIQGDYHNHHCLSNQLFIR